MLQRVIDESLLWRLEVSDLDFIAISKARKIKVNGNIVIDNLIWTAAAMISSTCCVRRHASCGY